MFVISDRRALVQALAAASVFGLTGCSLTESDVDRAMGEMVAATELAGGYLEASGGLRLTPGTPERIEGGYRVASVLSTQGDEPLSYALNTRFSGNRVSWTMTSTLAPGDGLRDRFLPLTGNQEPLTLTIKRRLPWSTPVAQVSFAPLRLVEDGATITLSGLRFEGTMIGQRAELMADFDGFAVEEGATALSTGAVSLRGSVPAQMEDAAEGRFTLSIGEPTVRLPGVFVKAQRIKATLGQSQSSPGYLDADIGVSIDKILGGQAVFGGAEEDAANLELKLGYKNVPLPLLTLFAEQYAHAAAKSGPAPEIERDLIWRSLQAAPGAIGATGTLSGRYGTAPLSLTVSGQIPPPKHLSLDQAGDWFTGQGRAEVSGVMGYDIANVVVTLAGAFIPMSALVDDAEKEQVSFRLQFAEGRLQPQ